MLLQKWVKKREEKEKNTFGNTKKWLFVNKLHLIAFFHLIDLIVIETSWKGHQDLLDLSILKIGLINKFEVT